MNLILWECLLWKLSKLLPQIINNKCSWITWSLFTRFEFYTVSRTGQSNLLTMQMGWQRLQWRALSKVLQPVKGRVRILTLTSHSGTLAINYAMGRHKSPDKCEEKCTQLSKSWNNQNLLMQVVTPKYAWAWGSPQTIFDSIFFI